MGSRQLGCQAAWALWRRGGLRRSWRDLALAIVGAVVVAAVVLVIGLAQMQARSTDRERQRSFVLASADEGPAGGGLHAVSASDTFEGRQWEVMWVEPDPRSDVPLAPGLEAWPEPGSFAVSPGLASAIRRSPELRARYRSTTVIGDAGVADRGEWFAYARPALGRGLGKAGTAVMGIGGGPLGDGTGRSATLVVAVGVAVAVGIPALLVLAAGTSAASPALDRRSVLLHRIGVPRQHLRWMGATEAALGAAPGVLIGAGAGLLGARSLGRIPFTTVEPVPGDLVVGWPVAVAASIGVLAVVALWAGVRAGRRLDRSGPRPVAAARRSRALLVPACIGGALLASSTASSLLGGGASAKPSAGATLLLVVGVPLALPALAAVGGRAVASGSSVTALLAGRRIEADPSGSVRPMLALASVLFVVLTAAGFVVSNRSTDAPPMRDRSLDAATVLHADPRPRDLVAMRDALPDDLVVPFDGATIDATCPDLRLLALAPCDAAGVLSDEAKQRIGRLLALAPDEAGHLELGRLASSDRAGAWKLVVGPREPSLTSRVEVAAGQHLVAPQVASVENMRPAPSPLWGWVLLGTAGAAALLGIAATLSMIDGGLRAAASHGVLGSLGAGARAIARLEVAQFVVAYALAVGVTLVIGSINAWIMIRTAPTAAIPILPWVGLVAASVLAGALGAAAVWLRWRLPSPAWR